MHPYTISHLDPRYPELLKESTHPPNTIHVRGTLPGNDRVYVAIVGTRRPDSYGVYVAQLMATELARAGVVIVSGLAYGLDATAHQAALDAGGTTLAVLGSGVDTTTPRAHLALGETIIARGGALISEQSLGSPARASFIIARNRIIAGMSHLTLVIQAAENSGTLHTAHFALDYGRPVYAAPGNITNRLSAGSNDLLRHDRAHVAVSPLDILDELKGELARMSQERVDPARSTPSLSGREAMVINLLEQHITTSHDLLTVSGLEPGELAETMSLLEITGRITNLGAGHWAIKRLKPYHPKGKV